MRIARFDAGRGPRLGLVTDDFAHVIDVSAFLANGVDDPRALMGNDALDRLPLQALRIGKRFALSDVALLCPLTQASTVYGVGLNYRDHARELGKPVPETPALFIKPSHALVGPHDTITAPDGEPTLDYEGELAIVIGKKTYRADAQTARDAIFGYAIANDLTLRRWAKPETLPLAKGFVGASPVGPWITCRRHVDVGNLRLRTWVNGALRQDSTTAEMAFDCVSLVVFITQSITLMPGDMILTGSPHGSGAGMAPPQWLIAGDCVTVAIEGLGEIRTHIANSA